MKKTDSLLLKHLRNDSRQSLAKIGKMTGVPVSTLYDGLRRLESRIIKRHISLLDFSKLGYNIKVNFAIKSKNRDFLKQHLLDSINVNSLYSLLNNDFDFYAECLFRDMKELTDFKEDLSDEISSLKQFFIIDDIKREELEF